MKYRTDKEVLDQSLLVEELIIDDKYGSESVYGVIKNGFLNITDCGLTVNGTIDGKEVYFGCPERSEHLSYELKITIEMKKKEVK